jgi:hypothetical protein
MSSTLTRKADYAQPTNDAYVVLLIISLVAMILGCALLYFDYSSYPAGKPQLNVARPAPAAPAGGGPGAGAGGGAAGQQGGYVPPAGTVPPGKDGGAPPKQ